MDMADALEALVKRGATAAQLPDLLGPERHTVKAWRASRGRRTEIEQKQRSELLHYSNNIMHLVPNSNFRNFEN